MLKIGEGRYHCDPEHLNIIDIPEHMWCNSTDGVIDQVFNNFDENIGNKNYLLSRAILCAKNDTVLSVTKIQCYQETHFALTVLTPLKNKI